MFPRQEVLVAFASQVEVGLNFEVVRNRAEPADLADKQEYVILLDGDEEPERIDENTGLALHDMHCAFACFVGGYGVSEPMTALLTKLRHAAVSDRTLGGLLWGEVVNDYDADVAYYNGMLVGGLVAWDVFSTVGASPAGYFSQEYQLTYATRPNDAMELVRMGEG